MIAHGSEPFEWNALRKRRKLLRAGVTFQDETLRDGIQSPSVTDPAPGEKRQLLHCMERLNIQRANVGLPASSDRNFQDSLLLCREIDRCRLRIRPVAAARTVVGDVLAIADVAERAGVVIEVYAFIGSSAIRQLAESWDVAFMQRQTEAAVSAAAERGLPICFVTEDTTRAHPETLRALWGAAIDAGASRICLTDTVGHATPDGVRNLLGFAHDVLLELGVSTTVGIDWHGHDDRGLALDNALTALECGADRIHATALGVGERVGNTRMELLLYNLMLLDELAMAKEALDDYAEHAARALGWRAV